MEKQIHRILSLLLLLALLLGMIPENGTLSVYAAEPKAAAEETEEHVGIPAATEETTPEAETPSSTEPETPREENAEASEAIGYGNPTGTLVELESIPIPDDILESTYNLQIPVILYGTTPFSVSFTYPGDPSQTTYTTRLSGFRYHYLNGQMAYCLEPQASSDIGAVYSQIAGGADLNVWERFLSDSQRRAISLVLAYGAPNTLTSSTKLTLHGYEAATQVIIWEIIVGYRSPMKPYALSNSGLYDFVLSLCNPNDNTGTLRAAYVSGYNAILASMASHEIIPSFTSKKLSMAETYEMALDAATGLYEVALTDTNNVLSDFTFQNGNGLTFLTSGNKLTVTATNAALQNSPLITSTVGKILDTENASPVIWGTTNSNHKVGQILTQMANPDPVPCYFKLKGPDKTNLTIQKVCADGNIAGITFTVTDSDGTVLFSGETEQDGTLNVPNLEVGKTVTITETVPDNYVAETRTKTITLQAANNTVSFRNIPLGTANLLKVSDTGNVEGYCFNLYRHADENNDSKTWHGKSDVDGRIYETNASYQALGDTKRYTFKGLTDGTYAFREVLSLFGAGMVWPNSITFSTSGGTTAQCSLVYSGDALTAQENGDCTISGIPLTGLDGGGTLTITIKNEPIPVGSITIKKVDESGRPMLGVTFLLEYSVNSGSTWTPVTSREETSPITLGGCTSAGLTDGKLTTGSDSLAAFTGLCLETDEGPVLYRLTETATKPGYSLLAGPAYEGPLPSEAHDVTLTAVNMPEFQIPMTGGRGFTGTAVSALVALTAGAALICLLRRKRNNLMEREGKQCL